MSESVVEQQVADRLAARLRELREGLDLTQEEVAERAGISRNHYQLLEIGWGNRQSKVPANPRLSTLTNLCHVLGTTVPDLIAAMYPAESSGR
ncbi:helix-turn-helix domain-containing protein [Jongsikchunia kroppenstedtii]|uniref:helix-turn-helix domain-containing protein n=1 Tax=Jongsikchunia kroppenstedtii TaxID=1121721 RepID=UPI000374ED6E|nr:helix-turn-helix transcriptional regulator [Jongsikchunia kroppenstedtii]